MTQKTKYQKIDLFIYCIYHMWASQLAPPLLQYGMNSSNKNKQGKVLIADIDYPQTYREFVEMFPDHQSCTDF